MFEATECPLRSDVLHSRAYFGTSYRSKFIGRLANRVLHGFTAKHKERRLPYVQRYKWEPDTWPEAAQGVGLTEAPRGALAHYVGIKDKKVFNYQMVVPTTWNASPRDTKGQHSAFEASLIGTPVIDPRLPLEIIRTIHSFDPCMACAVHLYDENGEHIHRCEML